MCLCRCFFGRTSFRTLKLAVAPAFRTVDNVSGMNLNYERCYWFQNGSETSDSLHRWVVRKCPGVEERKMTTVAKYVGALFGPDGHLHRLTAPRDTFVKARRKINESSESMVERLVEFKIYTFSVLRLVGSIAARVAVRWCSSITMGRWGRCTGCTGRWMQSLRCSVPSEELS